MMDVDFSSEQDNNDINSISQSDLVGNNIYFGLMPIAEGEDFSIPICCFISDYYTNNKIGKFSQVYDLLVDLFGTDDPNRLISYVKINKHIGTVIENLYCTVRHKHKKTNIKLCWILSTEDSMNNNKVALRFDQLTIQNDLFAWVIDGIIEFYNLFSNVSTSTKFIEEARQNNRKQENNGTCNRSGVLSNGTKRNCNSNYFSANLKAVPRHISSFSYIQTQQYWIANKLNYYVQLAIKSLVITINLRRLLYKDVAYRNINESVPNFQPPPTTNYMLEIYFNLRRINQRNFEIDDLEPALPILDFKDQKQYLYILKIVQQYESTKQ